MKHTLRELTYLLAAVFALGACSGCETALAELLEREGAVERDFAAQRETWDEATPGATFVEGDGLRTASAATALLRVGRGGRMRVEPNSTIRFYTTPQPESEQPAGVGIAVERGGATVEATDGDLPLQTGDGVATLARGGKLRVGRAEDGGVRYRVMLGTARFTDGEGRARELSEGETIVVGIGMAVLHTDDDPKTAAAVPSDEADRKGASSDVALKVQGGVRSRTGADERWVDLAPGEQHARGGTELDVSPGASVELERDGEQATLWTGRYLLGERGEALVRASDGELAVRARGNDVVIRVPGGAILARGGGEGTQARLRVVDERTELDVLEGEVSTYGAIGEERLVEGQSASLARTADDEGAAPDSSPPDDAEDRPARDHGVPHADLAVPAGRSFWVYDPEPPTAVGFEIRDCPEGAELRVEQRLRTRGRGQLNLELGPGVHAYSVRCLRGGKVGTRPVARGRVRVLRGSGTRRLPSRPSRNDVALDGRVYTVMYQNLLPVVNVSWPKAPQAAGYELRLESRGGGVKRFRSRRPRFTLGSGKLRDGVHKLTFATQGKDPKRSKPTTVEVLFDNAAPTASIELPPPKGVKPGKVSVKGVAVRGSSVYVGGRKLALDRQHRFATEVEVGARQRALAIRFQHPRLGLRYYLRRIHR